MGNNEISGLVVSLALAKWLKKKKIKNILIEFCLFLKRLV